jgi:hypothetical protein
MGEVVKFEPQFRMKFYILDADHKMVEVPMLTWAEWFEQDYNRVIAADRGKGWLVSSIFLGFDHSPLGGGLFFETMIIQGKDNDRDFFRFETYEECLKFHQNWVHEFRGVDHE